MKKSDFGNDFQWGATISAFQNEGHSRADGKGLSIWDTFTAEPKNIKNNDLIGDASSFYTMYEQDIVTAKSLGLDVFRFSISWSRIIPKGTGAINLDGLQFYHKVIDACLKNGLIPYITLYHWDLPQALEDKGGWSNREIIGWFNKYVEISVNEYKDKVSNWIVMNEPMTFVGLGYFMGYHAPQKKGITTFLKAAHHVVLSLAAGGRIIRKIQSNANIGVALSCSFVKPLNQLPKNRKAAKRIEALLNRFFLEPLLGLGYPTDVMPVLNTIRRYFRKGDDDKMAFDFDFIGLQYYFRVVAQHSLTPPVLFANEVHPTQRKANLNTMNLDVYPKGLYKILKFYHSYPQIKKIIISESGVCFPDFKVSKHVHDARRLKYHQKMLKHVLKAQAQNIPVKGYFVWTLVDNFEWKEGFEPRFGLVYNDFKTQERTIKDSGLWFQQFLTSSEATTKKIKQTTQKQ
ncbi:glycoside hydrolase family 1 protein [Carboxylicivirga caseinilyticus]|uniref:glycoside hydrolase family 1 protein n=1 Tax=Carboxylicivirga caseinilyticus TaxID=3417572 RepID=UPI003D329326|nr:family 1 glycosylhydrolase [Marinilabiliaceae bacterium A049]